MGVVIRRADLEDERQVVELGEEMAKTSPAHVNAVYRRDKASATFRGFLAQPTAAVWVAERDGAILGAMAGICVDHWCFDGKTASDLILYVRPGERGAWVGVNLVRAYRRWAIEQGAERIYLGTSTGIEPERFRALFQRLGFEHVGYALQYIVRR